MFVLVVLGGCPVLGEVLTNAAYRLEVESGAGGLTLALHDQRMGIVVADGLIHNAHRTVGDGALLYRGLKAVSVAVKGEALTIRGRLAGLDLEQRFILPADKNYMEEAITVANSSGDAVRLEEFEVGLRRRVASKTGRVPGDLTEDRVVALPFRRRPTDTEGEVCDYSLKQWLAQPGGVQRVNAAEKWQEDKGFSGYVPSRHRSSEGWAWTHRDSSFCVFKFNQASLEFSVISTVVEPEEVALRFGGACMVEGRPSCLLEIEPGRSISLGLNRYQTVKGGYIDGLYALRAFLDERGCRFPANYNPPVHWNELYDSPFWAVGTPGKPVGNLDDTRAVLYTRAMMEKEAAKARDYSCQALYLDPGWDSNFGTLIWGEQWLGPRRDFIGRIKGDYGLGVSLHCALASWMSDPLYRTNNPGVSSYPQSSFRKDADGRIIAGSICAGSRQYLDLALNRMLDNCAEGVVFLMFDGDWYQGGCWNREHGHPVPYREEDQVEAVAGLAQRVHAKYPKVLIEMHDPIGGGSPASFTPVYYKYGLPGSFDEKWGFELMWQPMHDLRTGAARALFYYVMGCNVPAYLHVDLREDNEHALVLWWYASTCRHLGIGGTHPNPILADLQMREMKRYRKLERFFKRGDFYGINEEIHLHVLPEENAFVANVFNLASETRVIRGEFDLRRATGLDVNRFYTRSGNWGEFDKAGLFKITVEMPPWSAQVGEFRAVEGSLPKEGTGGKKGSL
jgi:hypothetical protein